MAKKKQPAKQPDTARKLQARFSTIYLDEEPTEKQQSKSRLMMLPAELRSTIYELAAYSSPIPIRMDCHVCRPKGLKPPAGIALLMTCKQIQREAYEIVWDNMRFELEVNDYFLPRCPEGCMVIGPYWDYPLLSKMRIVFLHYEVMTASWTERLQIEKRDRALQSILIANQNIKHFELRSYGREPDPDMPKFRAGDPFLCCQIKRSYTRHYGKLLDVLEARRARVLQYNPTTQQMEETYKILHTKLTPDTWEEVPL